MIAFDHRERRIHLLALTDADGGEDADAWLAATERRLRALAREPPPLPPAPAAPGTLRFTLRDPPEAYLENIAACRREIFEGESYEICLTTELRSEGRSIRCPPIGRCARATPRRSPRCCGSASCPCSAPRPSGSCASTASAPPSRGR